MKMHAATKCLAASVLFLATSAQADPVKLSALPVGQLSKPPPPNKVHHVSGRTEGFFVKREQNSYVTIGANPADPEGQRDLTSPACIAASGGSQRFRHLDEENAPAEWSPQSQSNTAQGNEPAVQVFHREEVVVAGGKATLETRDALVDSTTAGAKTIDKRSLPLVQIRAEANGVTVYAFREAGQVQFVVAVSAAAIGQPGILEARLPGPMMQQNVMSSQCRHLRVASAVKEGEGSATSVLVRVFEPEPAGAPPEDRNGTVQRTMRMLAVHLSTSWLSGDPEPVVSVTSGWQGPAEKIRVAATSLHDRR